jgi:catechol 2,3-dioxygenase-like lactoylglutathione lyase family enzyme
MSLKNILIVSSDLNQSKQFYHDLFGLTVIREFEGNMILSEGLVLQERKTWESYIGESVVTGNASELFFEENNFDAFLDLLEKYPGLRLNEVQANSWGKRSVRLKDLDGNLIEVAER